MEEFRESIKEAFEFEDFLMNLVYYFGWYFLLNILIDLGPASEKPPYDKIKRYKLGKRLKVHRFVNHPKLPKYIRILGGISMLLTYIILILFGLPCIIFYTIINLIFSKGASAIILVLILGIPMIICNEIQRYHKYLVYKFNELTKEDFESRKERALRVISSCYKNYSVN